jgi:hypothetical protein
VGAALVATLAGAGLVTGCTPDRPAGPPVAGAPPEPEPDADVVLLGTVLAALDATAALVVATVERHPRTDPVLRPLVDVHAAHRAVLDEAAEVEQDDATAPVVPARPGAALDRVRRAETRLTGTLREATANAQSGDFARALASMTASLTQHLTVLGTVPATGEPAA